MKQEPIAWMYQDKSTHEVSFQKNMRAFVDHSKTYETPLYTAPRELSDEEIENIWHELYPLDSNNYWEDNRKGLCQLRFARAIMERCGIISGTDK